MTPKLDTALLMCGSPEQGRATSSRAGADLGRTSDSRVDASPGYSYRAIEAMCLNPTNLMLHLIHIAECTEHAYTHTHI